MLPLEIDEAGESWVAAGRAVEGDDVMVTVSYTVRGIAARNRNPVRDSGEVAVPLARVKRRVWGADQTDRHYEDANRMVPRDIGSPAERDDRRHRRRAPGGQVTCRGALTPPARRPLQQR